MKTNKHNFIWVILLCTSVVFGQKQTKKIDQNFKVNKNVLVEIDTHHADVTVEIWNKNIVSIKGIWEAEGMNKEEANEYFKDWGYEALGNKNKVVIKSNPSINYDHHNLVIGKLDLDYDYFDFDFDFDYESITHIGELFNGDYYSELPPMPMPPMPMPPMPVLPEPFMEHLSHINFDHKAYEKDKEGYLEKFQKQQEEWQKEFEAKIEPQMKQWQKEYEAKIEPQMKAYEKKMEQWQKEAGPKIKAHEKKMEAKMKVMEGKMKKKYAQKRKEKGAKISKKFNIKKSLVIKVPKGAIVKVNAHHGKIRLPEGIRTID